MNIYDDLTKEQKAGYVKAIKRLNERMRDLERRGLTDTLAYQKLSEWVANNPNKIDKTGHVRAIQTAKLNAAQMKRTMKLAESTRYTAGTELKMARRELVKQGKRPTADAVKEQANEYGRMEEYVRSNLEKLYDYTVGNDQPLTDKQKTKFHDIMAKEYKSQKRKMTEIQKWFKRTWSDL